MFAYNIFTRNKQIYKIIVLICYDDYGVHAYHYITLGQNSIFKKTSIDYSPLYDNCVRFMFYPKAIKLYIFYFRFGRLFTCILYKGNKMEL